MPKRLKRTVMRWMLLDTYVHVHGNRELRVDNCRRVLEYNDVCVRLQTRDLLVTIWGRGLRVSDYCDSSVLVTGIITGLELAEVRR